MNTRLSSLTLMLLLYVTPMAAAQPNYFWNAGSGAFSSSSKWTFNNTSPAGPPGTGDRALFLSSGGYTVSGNGSPAQVTVQGGTAIFTGAIAPQGNVTGFPSLVTGLDVGLTGSGQAIFQGSGATLNSAVPISVGGGSGGDGSLSFTQGATGSAVGSATSASVGIASHPAGTGGMSVQEPGSTFTATGTFDLGGRNLGTLSVFDHGSLITNGILALGQAGLNIGGSIPGATGAQGILTIGFDGTVYNHLQTNIGLYGKGRVDISGGSFTSTDEGTGNPAISIARFAGSEGHLNVSGTGYVNTLGELIVGGASNGTMTVTDSGLVESHVTTGVPAIVGFGSTANGLVTINGADAQWTVTDALVVGQTGTGEIDLVSGGTLFVENSHLENDLPYVYVGDGAGSHGTVTVTDEFSFLDASNITTTIGHDQSSTGQLTVSQKGRVAIQFTTIGDAGTGDVTVISNGELITGIAVLGAQSTGVGTATIDTGATWEVQGDLYVGDQGMGTLDVEDNSRLTVNGLISVGENSGSVGLLQITGSNAVVDGTYTSVTIGFVGNGEVALNSGAVWNVNTDVTMAEILASQGKATIDATSKWNVAGGIYVGGSAVATGGTGTLNVAGLVTSGTTVKIWDDSSALLINGGRIKAPLLTVEGTLAGNGTVEAVQATNDGTVAPERTGATTGRITFTGNYTQTAAGKLNIELGGKIPLTEFDQVVVGGVASLDGELHVLLTNVGLGLFEPVLGDQFVILTAQSFDPLHSRYAAGNFTFPDIGDKLGWDILYTATSLVLQVVIPGDYNDNGVVDAGDYVVWRKYVGTTHDLANDPIGGVIGSDQFNQWRSHFRQTAGGGAGAIANAAIPEPATAVLLMFATTSCCIRRRRSA